MITVIRHVGMAHKDVIPIKFQIHTVNNAGMNILDVAILGPSGLASSGRTLVTHQLFYVTDSTDKVLLSCGACSDPRMISGLFPSISKAFPQPDEHTTSDASLAQQHPAIDNPEPQLLTLDLLLLVAVPRNSYLQLSLPHYHSRLLKKIGKSNNSGSSITAA